MNEERYAPINETGMTEPEKPKSGKNMKVVFGFFGIGFVVIIGAILYGAWSFGLIGGKQAPPAPEISTSEAQLKQLLEERRELESRIKTLEEERSNMQNMAEMLSEKIEPLQRQIREIEYLKDEISRLRSEMARVPETMEEVEPPEPVQGSSSRTELFSSVREYQARREEAARVEIPEPKFTKAKGVQTGRMIPGKLLTTLISSTAMQDFYAVVETTENFPVSTGLTLPAGVRFLGKVIPDFESRRVLVKVERMQYGDVEMPVSGIVLDERGNPGLVSKYIDPLNQAMWGSLLPNMLAAAADAAQDMTDYYNDYYDEERRRPEFSDKNVALQGAADALRLQSQILMEMQMRKKPVIIVNKDIPVMIQVSERIPLEILLESGVVGE
jgi:uncharacterized protein YdcH (DUF465 family)